MGAMHEFLLHIEKPEVRALYVGLDETWNARAAEINARLEESGVPLRVANMSTVWTILYTQPSRYNWMFQYYLRREGLALSWVGTGRLIFSLNYTAEDFEAVASRFVAAAESMLRDGWWWEPAEAKAPRTTIKRQILKEMLAHRFTWLAGSARQPNA
jgi:glutamate-1-semialdehyde 2,1-aminomutase